MSDSLDRSILNLLQDDGRLASLEIARRLGVSEKTIRTRIARLTREHGMRVVATLNSSARQTRMLFLVHTQPGSRFEVADRLARLPAVQRVFATTGAFDLVVEGAFQTDADALEFLVREVEAVDGLDACESVHLIKEVLPGEAPIRAGRPGDEGRGLDFRRFVALAARATTEEELLVLGAQAAVSVCGADRSLVSLLEVRDAVVPTGRSGGVGPPLIRMTTFHGCALRDEYVREVVRRVNEGESRGVSSRVVESGLHVFIEDTLTDPLMTGLHDLVRAEGYRSFMAVPMFREGRVIGTLNLYYDERRQLADDEIAVAQAFADQLSSALSRVVAEEVA
ncbi:MAG: GAF domain-containing protein [Chloroflexi bacterium]|nr:GAF domain-containing protein [Chloroflexota bacterium]